ncbi:MAG: hypothetical protein IGQ88_06210 [Gloeomargaritaceae cyanobacterium C42_A2020_066]|nr:hypothetical protein [Gloeomargaritaceae cyanobacterium C42_A2020_066]
MAYSTQELVDFLEAELRRNWAAVAGDLGQDQISRVGLEFAGQGVGLQAYERFRRLIHQYQENHGVSGLVWREIQMRGEYLRFPLVHPELVAVTGDLDVLQSAKPAVIGFWAQVTAGRVLATPLVQGRRRRVDRFCLQFQVITQDECLRLIEIAEWAIPIKVLELGEQLNLVLGWGRPAGAPPWESGANLVVAVPEGEEPLEGYLLR